MTIPSPGFGGNFIILGHKNDEIGIPIVEEIRRHFKETTVVITGIHIDNATAEYIDQLNNNKNKPTHIISMFMHWLILSKLILNFPIV
jgi:hypothetical protein